MSAKTTANNDAWASDAAHTVLEQQTQQNLASAMQAAAAAEQAHEQAAQITSGGQS